MRFAILVVALAALAAAQVGLPANRNPYIGPVIGTGQIRPIDGMANNQVAGRTQWGATGRALVRGTGLTAYGPTPNDFNTLRGGDVGSSTLPNARLISNAVQAIDASLGNFVPSVDLLSGLFPFLGQFVDHDHDLTGEASPVMDVSITAPAGDPFFDPMSFGNGTITVDRFEFLNAGSTGMPRQHPNQITGYIDNGNIYGSTAARRDALRGITTSVAPGNGRLASCADVTSNSARVAVCQAGAEAPASNYLPPNALNTGLTALPNAAGPNEVTPLTDRFVSGDVRVNENFALGCHHTMFFREHNRLAAEVLTAFPTLNDLQVFEEARRWMIAIWQHIVFDEYLSVLLGAAWPPYAYSSAMLPNGGGTLIEVGTWHEASSASYRLGHSMITDFITRRDALNNTITGVPDLRLAEGYFIDPGSSTITPGITPTLTGLTLQTSEQIDRFFVDSMRNFLFGTPDNFVGSVNFNELGGGGLDLAAINIQRGREVGLPSYNSARQALGLAAVTSFAAGPFDATTQAALIAAYGTNGINDCDLIVCSLAETHLANAQVGETLFAVLRPNFGNLRTGDRFFWENTASDGQGLSADQRLRIERTSYRDVIVRNTALTEGQMQCLALGHRDGCAGESVTTNTGVQPSNEDDTFIVSHAAKVTGDPNFGRGHDIGYRVEVSNSDQEDDLIDSDTQSYSTGQTLMVHRSTTYTFYCANSCATRFYIYSPSSTFQNDPLDGRWYPETGSNVEIAPSTTGAGCAGRQFTWQPDSNTANTLYYGNRFFRYYGGQITVLEEDSSANGLVLSALALLAALAVFLF